MQKNEYVGKSLEDALDQAANDFGTERENVSYNILPSNGGGGFIKKLFSKSIKVEAWVEKTDDLQEAARKAVQEAIDGKPSRSRNSRGKKGASESGRKLRTGADSKEAASSEKKPQRQQKPKNKNQDKQSAKAKPQSQPRRQRPVEENPNAITFDEDGVIPLLEEYTGWFMKVFNTPMDDVTFNRTEDGNMKVTAESEMLEDLLGRSDRLAGSFEHVFKRIVQKKIGDLPQRLHLDSGEAAEKRMENLKDMARSMAEKVKTTGRSITVNSKSGQERRTIHVTIDEIEGVATRSIGSGEGRKLVIYSLDKKRQRKPRKGGQTQTREQTENGAEGENPELALVQADGEKAARPKRSRNRRPRNRKPREAKPAGEEGSSSEEPQSHLSQDESFNEPVERAD